MFNEAIVSGGGGGELTVPTVQSISQRTDSGTTTTATYTIPNDCSMVIAVGRHNGVSSTEGDILATLPSGSYDSIEYNQDGTVIWKGVKANTIITFTCTHVAGWTRLRGWVYMFN